MKTIYVVTYRSEVEPHKWFPLSTAYVDQKLAEAAVMGARVADRLAEVHEVFLVGEGTGTVWEGHCK